MVLRRRWQSRFYEACTITKPGNQPNPLQRSVTEALGPFARQSAKRQSNSEESIIDYILFPSKVRQGKSNDNKTC